MVRLSPPAIAKKKSLTRITLAAIAKGYGVDSLADLLNSMKIKSYIIEIGGEVKTKGKKDGNQTWRVGIASPNRSKPEIKMVLNLEDLAVATSGDYQNYFEKNGKFYSHTIDPRTGYPVSHGLASVTVVNASCMHADAMATAINVMGPEKGFRFAREQKLAAYLIVRKDNVFVEKMTDSFKKYIHSQ